MKLSILAGATSQSCNIFIQDSSSTTGAGLTGLVYNTSSLTAYYSFSGANATATSITLATLAAVNSAYSSGGFKEIDSTNMPGWYRFDIPNAAIATSKGRSVGIHFKGATNMAPCPIELELTGWDNQDSVHGGLTCLPNTAVTTNGSLITSGTGTDQLQVSSGNASADAKKINAVSTSSVTTINANQGTTQPVNFTGTSTTAYVKTDMVDIAGAAVSTSTAQIGVNAVNIGGTAQTGRDIGASVLLSSGTGTGQITLSSGTVTVGTNNDKTGYTASTVSDKTGYALTAAYDLAKTAAQAGDAMALTSGERNSTADALLARNVSGGSSTGRTVKQALHFIRNKWTVSTGTLTVYDTDDSTSSWTATVTATPGADPITANDPA